MLIIFFTINNILRLPRWYNDKESASQHRKCEMWAQSLDWYDPLEKEMATHSSILNWKIPWTEELGKLQSMGFQRVRHDLSCMQMTF